MNGPRMNKQMLVVIGVFFLSLGGTLRAGVPNVRLPEGFVLSEVSGPQLANDIYAMTLDPNGRIIVSGRGYIRILHDDNQDGIADRATDFDAGPKFGAMGLLWEDDALYATDDGSLMRYHDRDHDDRADGPAEVLFRLNHAGEHGVHGIARGPDGWMYLAAGDGARANAKTVTSPTSPILDPRGGCVIRLSPDFQRVEIVADGFRNPYDLDFGVGGEFFTYDSDNERCVSLPWYEPTRFYHVVPGGHCGWLSRIPNELWRQPPYFADVVPPVTALDRGSPTGVVCYRHLQFPEKYRGSFFALDWTFGRIWHVPLEPAGSTYTSKPELFLEAVGSEGFAPTDAAVDAKTGDLLVCIGGRGTKGAVYRIRYAAGVTAAQDVVAVQNLQPLRRNLDGEKAFIKFSSNTPIIEDPVGFRIALEMSTRFVDHMDPSTLEHSVVRGWISSDRLTRQAASRLEHRRRDLKLSEFPISAITKGNISITEIVTAGIPEAECWSRLKTSMLNFSVSTSEKDRLSYVRATQILLGDIGQANLRTTIWDGYSLANPQTKHKSDASPLVRLFPTGMPNVDREISRLAAMIESDDANFAAHVLERFTMTSDPAEDIHYLIVLARLQSRPVPAETAKVAEVLLSLDDKIEKLHRKTDRNFPLRLHELHEGLARRDASLNEAILASALFGSSEDLLWTEAKGFNRKKGAERFLTIVNSDKDFKWSSDLVELLSLLPEDVALPLLRSKWDNVGLRDSIARQLAKHPQEEDIPRLVAVLTSSDAKIRNEILKGLESLSISPDESVLLLFYKPLAQWSRVKEEASFTNRLVQLLGRIEPEHANRSAAEWLAWFATKDPETARKLESPDGIDVSAWKKRLGALDWSQGSKDRGKVAYEKIGCQQCHSGSRAVGPDLAGIGKRFSRDEIFTAILQPSRDVPDRYRMTRITTEEGQLFQGVVVYEAVDGTILQLANLETVRIKPEDVAERSGSPLSLMPNSLLESVTDQQVVDLYSFLQSL